MNSYSKTVDIQPELVKYERTLGKPAFDLIIGTRTMNELGIILDFNTKVITIDSIILQMQSIGKLPTSNEEALGYNNSLAKNQEPKSTESATQRIVHILDAKYEKANLPDIVNNNCTHSNPDKQNKLLEVLTEFADLIDGTLGYWKTEPVSFELK